MKGIKILSIICDSIALASVIVFFSSPVVSVIGLIVTSAIQKFYIMKMSDHIASYEVLASIYEKFISKFISGGEQH